MSTNCERRRHLGAVQLAESTSSYSTSAVRCCAHSEQLNMSRLQPGVPVREMSYSRIARPQLGHAGVLATGCSDDLNKLNWGMAPLLALPTNPQQRPSLCPLLRPSKAPVQNLIEALAQLLGMRQIYQKSNLRAIGPRSNKSS
jgi:hypothetical protein